VTGDCDFGEISNGPRLGLDDAYECVPHLETGYGRC
jgi:hypothetical protein